ncbi:hypothetical protein GCM10010390_26380 [Streptomyces mordarskii]|uniref:Uncharacterized protein n=1 Tax=Streptomyces mordarskii TaxID=1226758 RepID=A0ABP3MPP0_9ACTN
MRPRTTTSASALGPAWRAVPGTEPWAAVAGRAPKTAGWAKSATQSRQIWATWRRRQTPRVAADNDITMW